MPIDVKKAEAAAAEKTKAPAQAAPAAAPSEPAPVVAAVAAQANEKTQTSSTPLSPEQKRDDLPPPMPVVKVNLQYRPIEEISNSQWYIKHVPNVYADHCAFNFADEDYEICVKDREFIKSSEMPEISTMAEKDFERIIDCLEKVAYMYRDRQPKDYVKWFWQHCDDHLTKTLKKPVLDHIVT